MKKILLLLSTILICIAVRAQKNVKLFIHHALGSDNFVYNQSSTNNLGNDFKLTRVDYYISGISILHDGGQQTDIPDTYLIVKGDNDFYTDLGSLNITNLEGIKFSIGVDADQNHNDPSLEPAGSALSFQSPSMHWGWSSGYRFVALEGYGGSNLSNLLQYHGLFDQNYFSQTIQTTGHADGNDVLISIKADYKEALRDIDVTSGGIHHGDNTADLKVLKNFRDYVFSESNEFPLAVKDLNDPILAHIFPIPSENLVHISLENMDKSKADAIAIYDFLGREIEKINLNGQSKVSHYFTDPGVYIIQILSNSEILSTNKIVVNK